MNCITPELQTKRFRHMMAEPFRILLSKLLKMWKNTLDKHDVIN